MRAILVAVFIAMSAGLASAQTPNPNLTAAQQQQWDAARAAIQARVDQLNKDAQDRALGGLALTADRIVLEGNGWRAFGVTITVNDVVITADDAFFQNGEVRLGANARVRATGR